MKKNFKNIIIALALLLTVLCTVAQSWGQSLSMTPAFGAGRTQVRLYVSYFCPPCRALEPQAAPVLESLVRRNVITLTFVDVPSNKTSVEYASTFLKAVHGKQDIGTAMAARKLLISAAENGIKEKSVLESYLKGRGVALVKTYDPACTFRVYSQYMRQDRVTATPTCVIVDAAGRKMTFNGGQEILDALNKLGAVRVAGK